MKKNGNLFKVEAGSIFASLLALAAAMTGGGFLTLPVIGRQNGWFPMVFLVLLTITLTTFGNYLLGQAFVATKATTFTDLVAKASGKIVGYLSAISLIAYVLIGMAMFYDFGISF